MIVNVNSLKRSFGHKKIFVVLSKIFGIGFSTSKILCQKHGLNPQLLAKDISSKKANNLSKTINDNLIVDIELGAFLKKAKNLHYSCDTYKGVRYKMYLPVNGQRTRSNASIGKPFRVVEEDQEKRKGKNLVIKKRPRFFPKL